MSTGHTTFQHCENCDHVGPVPTAIVYSRAGHGEFLDVLRCERCDSQDVEPCFTCTDCHAALPVIEDLCVPCAVKFYTAFPLEFDEGATAPGGRLFWHMTPEHIEAANQIRNAIQRHNGVKAA
jgi:hypothetical protein